MGVELQRGALWQQKLKVRMHVDNPNDRTLPIKGITYTLDVNGQEFAHGESAASFVVPALGEAEFDMNMTANMAGTIISLLSHGTDANVEYHLSRQDLPLGRLTPLGALRPTRHLQTAVAARTAQIRAQRARSRPYVVSVVRNSIGAPVVRRAILCEVGRRAYR